METSLEDYNDVDFTEPVNEDVLVSRRALNMQSKKVSAFAKRKEREREREREREKLRVL